MKLPQVLNDVYELLEPLAPEDRAKVVSSVLTLLGEGSKVLAGSLGKDSGEDSDEGFAFGARASRWMSQNGISNRMIEDVFHEHDGVVEVIASEVPGNGRKRMSQNCYLLSGIRALLETDEPRFEDGDAVELCKHIGCYDVSNHATYRNDLGNVVAGSKSSGYTLPAPGLRSAGELVKQMASAS